MRFDTRIDVAQCDAGPDQHAPARVGDDALHLGAKLLTPGRRGQKGAERHERQKVNERSRIGFWIHSAPQAGRQNWIIRVRFMSGWPPSEAVVGSPVTLPNCCGLRKSTVTLGGLKLYVLNAFCMSQRSCTL